MNRTITRSAIAVLAAGSIFVGSGQASAGDVARDEVAPSAVCYQSSDSEGDPVHQCDVEDPNGIESVTIGETDGSKETDYPGDCTTHASFTPVISEEWKEGVRAEWVRVVDCLGNDVKFEPDFKE